MRTSHPPRVTIVGGGIVGVSTAFFLAQAYGEGMSITVIDNAPLLFAGASGKANGVLGDDDFPVGAEDVGHLSWKLYRKLANDHQGGLNWGHRALVIHELRREPVQNASDAVPMPTHPLPPWLKGSKEYADTIVQDQRHAARINPADFCKWLLEQCKALGVQVLVNATVTGVQIEKGSLKSVNIKHGQKALVMECQNLVIAAGPWSDRVLNDLFPASRVRIQSNVDSASGNYLLLKTPKGESNDEEHPCDQIYLKGVLGHDINITSRPDGTLYIGAPCGSFSAEEALPEITTEVQPQYNLVGEMAGLAAKVIDFSPDADVKVLEIGRAYRPFLQQPRPIISRIPLHKLLGRNDPNLDVGHESKIGGIFLNTGHGSDGIALGPGSGKIMSEMIRGVQSLSADVSGLGYP